MTGKEYHFDQLLGLSFAELQAAREYFQALLNDEEEMAKRPDDTERIQHIVENIGMAIEKKYSKLVFFGITAGPYKPES
jgi:hypothetical protein